MPIVGAMDDLGLAVLVQIGHGGGHGELVSHGDTSFGDSLQGGKGLNLRL